MRGEGMNEKIRDTLKGMMGGFFIAGLGLCVFSSMIATEEYFPLFFTESVFFFFLTFFLFTILVLED